MRLVIFLSLCAVLVLSACSSRHGKGQKATYKPAPLVISNRAAVPQKVGRPYKALGKRYKPRHEPQYKKTGIASWYGGKFHGRKTASGEVFNQNTDTAAHKTLPLPSLARVTNLENGASLVVRVNDRGPFIKGRIIDVSKGVAKKLGFYLQGKARVRVEYIGEATKYGTALPRSHKKKRRFQYASSRGAPHKVKRPVRKNSQPAPSPARITSAKQAKTELKTLPKTVKSVTSHASKFISQPRPNIPPPGRGRPAPFVVAKPLLSHSKPFPSPDSPPQQASKASRPGHITSVAEPSVSQRHVKPLPVQAQTPPPLHHDKLLPPSPSLTGEHYVQVASFAEHLKAELFLQRVQATGRAVIQPARVLQKDIYRVLLGPYTSRDEADKARLRLAVMGYESAFVISKF